MNKLLYVLNCARCSRWQRLINVNLQAMFGARAYSIEPVGDLQVCDLKPGELVHVLGDAHVYLNHIDALEEQLQNDPRPFPTLHINPAKKDIDRFTFEDFEIRDYNPHKKIAMKMAI
jgi:dihydrofolate reductase / thymidylate synthase